MKNKTSLYFFSVFTYIIIVFLSSCNSEINEAVKEVPIKYKYGYDESKYYLKKKR